jgi:hypothetical protein
MNDEDERNKLRSYEFGGVFLIVTYKHPTLPSPQKSHTCHAQPDPAA